MVFRKTPDVNETLKLCAKCSRQFRKENDLGCTSDDKDISNYKDHVDNTSRSDPETLTVPEELCLYRKILDYVEEWHNESPDKTFLDLYLIAKEQVRI
jgi:hypothetical protein